MSLVESERVTVYRVNGRGKAWHSKAAAYRHAAIQLVNEACNQQHGPEGWGYGDGPYPCKYCSRECDGQGRTNGKRTRHPDGFDHHHDGDGYSCEGDPTHSYRYRLVGRLARWLRWRDELSVEPR